jgi:hypothetical protein
LDVRPFSTFRIQIRRSAFTLMVGKCGKEDEMFKLLIVRIRSQKEIYFVTDDDGFWHLVEFHYHPLVPHEVTILTIK